MRKLGHRKLPQISFFLRKISSSFAFLEMVFGLGGSERSLASASIWCYFAVQPLAFKAEPWEEPHSTVEMAWGDALVEALALRVASYRISHLGFSSGVSPLFRCHVPCSRSQ